VLNRIYIIVGVLAIVVLAGAFIAPNFIRWSDYRGRMEQLATSVLGTPVTVRGDIDFTLLPQPRLRFSNVLVGSPEEPAATVDHVEAEFALMDFLRDNYQVTRLVLRQPVVDFTIDESGFLGSGVSLAEGTGSVGLEQATIVGATVRLMDRRSSETFVAQDVSGELRLAGFSGPFSFQGSGSYRDQSYGLRFNSGEIDATGQSRVSAFLQQPGSFTLALEGLLAPGMAPKFEGDMVYRQTPPTAEAASDIRGDLVLESKITGSTDRIVLSGYTLRPDENRGGTRLTGAASIQLGDVRSFDAVISGGVFSLPPRDANEDATAQPYELVRLLSELPAPAIPPMAGRVGVDLAEVGLRGFALRNVRVDASTDGQAWEIEQFLAQLPGGTDIRASGDLASDSERPAFRGDVAIASARLDGLAGLWRDLGDDDTLFNEPGALTGQVMLAGDALGLVNGVLTLDERQHSLEIRLGFGEEKRLDLVAQFDELGERGSLLLAALLPDIADEPRFGMSFPIGSFSLTSQSAQVLGLNGSDLVAEGQWGDARIEFSQLAAGDWGGASFDTILSLAGTLAEPVVSGSGWVRLEEADAPALLQLHRELGTPPSWREALTRSVPLDLLVDVDEPLNGSQIVTLSGKLGPSDLTLRAELGGGISELGDAPLRLNAALESTDVAALTAQIGFGEAAVFSEEGTMLVSLGLEGSPSNSVDANFTASLNDESISYFGNLILLEDGEFQGTGELDIALEDAGGLAAIVGAPGLSLPPAEGSALLQFEGLRMARLTEITGISGNEDFSGELAISRTGSTATVTGNIAVDTVSAEGLAAILLGRGALVDGDGAWPEGPIVLASQPRQTRGTVGVTAAGVVAGGAERTGPASFELSWDETRTRLVDFEAEADLGTIGLDVTVCCAGPLVDKTVAGRLSIAATPIDLIVPQTIGGTIDGVVDAGMQFQGTGASLAEVAASMTGEGNFTLTDLSVGQLSPEVYTTVAGLDDVLNMEPDAMRTLMEMALGQGAFTAPTATGAFTIAGGVMRLANFMVEGAGATMAGDLNVALASLGLDGSFVMTPRGLAGAGGLVGPDTSRIILRLAGTLVTPVVALDLEDMVAGVLVRANEIEVDRLEALRAEDAERQRAAAQERNRLIEEQRRSAAEEAAELAAEEAARQAAEEEEALPLQPEPQPTEDPTPSIETLPNQPLRAPLNLGFQPLVNQSLGPPVNQPLF
jgi:hypothetical protein